MEKQSPATITMQAMVQITTDGVPKLHCPICNKALVSLNGYVKHTKKHEPPGGFMCRYCDARFCTELELKRHRDETHTAIACRICKSVTFNSEEDYREHIRVIHNGVDREMYICDKCGAEYKTLEPYKRHMETLCGTVKPHKCEQCKMSFVTKYNLKQHKESIHTGERKFCCSYCGKNFLQKGRLIEHERSHTGEKPYKCDVCGKCFAHRESIVTHSSIHTGIRLVECKCCHSSFSCYSNLIKHRRTRPDTCGLPEYDPPRNRIRSHRSRIPATLNPTSEIKVSSSNRIITSDAKEHKKQKISRDKKENGIDMPTTIRRRGTRKCTESEGKPIRKKRKKNITSDDNSDRSDSEIICKRKTRKRRKEVLPNTKQSNAVATPKEEPHNFALNSSESEDFPDFDPIDSEESLSYGNDSKLNIKQEHQTEIEVQAEAFSSYNEFEYTNTSEFVDAAFNIKSEDDMNIFSEKDKLLDCLLNDKNVMPAVRKNTTAATDSREKVKTEDASILEEPEMVMFKDVGDDTEFREEDILDVRDVADIVITKCKIVLEDIATHYPKLKDDKTITIETNNMDSLLQSTDEQPPPTNNKITRKRRKRKIVNDGDDVKKKSAPNRMAKISQKELKERLKISKKEENSWSCPYCIKIYYMRKPFENHLRQDHERTADEVRETLKSQQVVELNDEVFKCHVCDKIYLMEKRLLAHVKLHGPDANLTFKCPCYCNIYFASKDEATAHAHKDHHDLLYCNLCKKFMTGHDSLKSHMKNHHVEKNPRVKERNLVCDKCGKKFGGRTALTDHVRSDCGRMPLYACNICDKHLTTAGILKTHMLLHKDETPFQCDQCGKTFKVKAQYKTHIKTRHSDYKPFKCHLCPKEYPYRESLLTHMTVHTGIKRFLCNGCGKRFTCVSNLQAHRKVHAETCGMLPLNAKATQYMGVQKGNLLLGAKPEAGLDYIETNTLVAREVIDRDLPMAQELNYPTQPALAALMNCTQPVPPVRLMSPTLKMPPFVDNAAYP